MHQDQPSSRGRPSAQDTGTSAGQDELAVQFSRLARALQQPDDPDSTIESIVQAAVQLIPSVDEASISVVVRRRQVTSRAPSGELARAVDTL